MDGQEKNDELDQLSAALDGIGRCEREADTPAPKRLVRIIYSCNE